MNRRKFLQWIPPVVTTVVLPAHAACSAIDCTAVGTPLSVPLTATEVMRRRVIQLHEIDKQLRRAFA